jgi:hypothetical protein
MPHSRSVSRRCRLVGSAALAGSLLFAFSSPGSATTVSVGCTGGSGGTYSSIGAALAALSGTPGPHTINVTGTCTESNFIQDFVSLTIQAPSAGAATVVALPDSDGFDVSRSRDVRFRFLAINGSPASMFGAGIGVFNSAEVIVESCTVSSHMDVGVAVDRDSLLTIRGSLLQNNGDGVDVSTDSTATISDTTIQNNAFVGVFVFDRSAVTFARQNSISNNGDTGVAVQDLSRAVFNQRAGPPLLATTIENNRFAGIVVVAQSLVRMGGQHKIRNNGCNNDPSCSLNLTGGVYVIRNSTFRGSGGLEISGNMGPGVTAEQGINAAFSDTKFNNNTGDGLQIKRISIGNLVSGNTFSGNGGASFSCDTTSLVTGDVSGINNFSCKQIERENGPPRPGKFKALNP